MQPSRKPRTPGGPPFGLRILDFYHSATLVYINNHSILTVLATPFFSNTRILESCEERMKTSIKGIIHNIYILTGIDRKSVV